jgi:hypothetical protein
MRKKLSKKAARILALILFIIVLFYAYLKFFLNESSAIVMSIVVVIALAVWILYFLKKKDVIEEDITEFLKASWMLVLFAIMFCWGIIIAILLSIEDISPEKTVETIQAQRLPNKEITKRISCDSIQRFIEHDVSLDTIKHYRYHWGVMRNHDDTIRHKNPVFAYTRLNRQYSVMPETNVDGYELKCGEGVVVDVQKKYFEGSKYKPFTRFIVMEYNENGIRRYSEFENEPQSENNESNLYDLFFDGALAQWHDTINVPQFYCSLPAAPSTIQQIFRSVRNNDARYIGGDESQSANYSTREDAYDFCDAVCKKTADKLLSGFNYTEYKACLSTIEVYRTYKQVERTCGIAKITVNRNRGFLSRRPYSCNSAATWEMVKKP